MKEGWKYVEFKDVYPIKMGKTPPRSDASSWDKEKTSGEKWVSIADISSHQGKTIYDTKEYISRSAAEKIYKVAKGSLLMSFKLSIGRMAFAGDDLYTNEAIIAIPESKDYELKFIFYYLSCYDWLSLTEGNEKVKGATLNKQSIGKINLPVVSLSEQEEIVTYLDTSFAKIDAIKANAEKELEEAKKLFAAALNDAMTPKEGWVEKTLGDICNIIRGKRFVRADIVENGVPCIHYGDIYTFYGLSANKTKGCISSELAKKMRFAEKNDVVVVQAGENKWDIGVGVAYFGEKPAAVHDACFILKHNQNPMYISYYLRSYRYHWYLLDYVHEGKICSFLKPALEKAPISLPPLSDQHSIVTHLDTLSEKVRQLQSNYEKISSECDALKQAILRDTFE